jgi:T1SS-143 domain-containing protein
MTRDPSGTNENGLHETAGAPAENSEAAPVFAAVAQAAGTPPVQTAPPATLIIKPGPGNIAELPQGTSLAQVAIEGDNIVLVQPDGTRYIIEGGALDIPTFMIGGAEIPQDAVVLAFKSSDIDVAAGPEGLSIVTAQSPDSGGNNFAEDVPGIGDAGPPIDLLAPTNLSFDAPDGIEPGGTTNIAPGIVFLPGGVSLLGVVVDEDALGGDEDGNFNPAGDPVDGSPPVDPDGTDPHNTDGDSLTEIVTGQFQLSDPNGIADIDTLTITPPGGIPQTFDINNLVGAQVQGAHGILTITNYNAATGVGTFEYELTENIDGPTADNGENIENGADSFTFVVSDGALDSAPATLNVNVVDDVPELWSQSEQPTEASFSANVVDEDDIETGRSHGTSPNDGNWWDGSYTGNPNNDAGGPAHIFGSVGFLVNFGADGPQLESEGGAFNISNDSVDGFLSLGLTSKGGVINYALSADGSTLTAFVGSDVDTGRVVFKFAITDSQDGDWHFRLFDQIDHQAPDSGADENFDLDQDEGVLDALDFGQYIVATDGDGDTVHLDGRLDIEIRDDVPELVPCKLEIVRVDEDDIDNSRSQGTSPDDGAWVDGSYTGSPNTNNGGAATVEGSLAHLVRVGADEKLTFSFIGEEGAVAKLEDLGLTSKGKDLSYSVENGVLTAYVDGANHDRTVFKLTLNSDGTYKFQLFDQLDHDQPQHGADQNFDLQDSVEGDVSSIDFGELIKATDHDGDSVILDDVFKVLIRDDIPTVCGTEHQSVNENDLADFNPFYPIVFDFWQGSLGTSPNDGPGDGSITGLFGTVPVWGSLADNVETGADEKGKFHLVSEAKAENLLANLDLSSKGDAIDHAERVNIPGVGEAMGFFASDGRLVFGLYVGKDGI